MPFLETFLLLVAIIKSQMSPLKSMMLNVSIKVDEVRREGCRKSMHFSQGGSFRF